MKTVILSLAIALPAAAGELTISGTRFRLDGKPFPYTGISFFNAIYNPAFNKSAEERTAWLRKFRKYEINVLRVWAQWDTKRSFVDLCAECSLYFPDGRLREANVARVRQIAAAAEREGMIVELVLFAGQSWGEGIRLPPEAADRAVAALTRALLPHRNVAFQVWNEFSNRVLDHVKTIRSVDPKRLVTNSPGIASVLGDDAQNRALDYLTPHTSRQNVGKTWEVAPAEIRYLLARWHKPVVDDEPARNGTRSFGGPGETTYPYDHILQIYRVWQAGAYINYHHDMFQTGAGSPAVPPSGVPDPEFNPYHRAVLEFIALQERYAPKP
jgi:hypothetical protein